MIQLPALRDRGDDLILFADYFLAQANHELGKNIQGFPKNILNCFKAYPWPGNIRELKNVIRRLVLLSDADTILTSALPLEIAAQSKDVSTPFSRSNESPDLKNRAQEAEYETIMQVLKQVSFNKSKAAEILNIDRKTLYNKMKSFSIK
jgi:two-component system response regulator HydG